MRNKLKVIARWIKMLSGKSTFHIYQKEGLYYDTKEIKGYYSDLRHKVLMARNIDESGVLFNCTQDNKKIYFPIAIFQYGLGAYDLFLETNNPDYKEKFLNIVSWAINNQDGNGSWNAFGWNPSMQSNPYSSMAQGEGASLLCRAYIETGKMEYLESAKKAISYMLKPTSELGTTIYGEDIITLEEMSNIPTVLNGMMFSIWGLYDVCMLTDNQEFNNKLIDIEKSLQKILKKFDRGFWSNYNMKGDITSPFYHDLHIEQLKVMYKMFGSSIYKDTYERWQKYQKSFCKSKLAFIIKAFQKLRSINSEVVLVK